MPNNDKNLEGVIEMGCWTPVVRIGDENDLNAVLKSKMVHLLIFMKVRNLSVL